MLEKSNLEGIVKSFERYSGLLKKCLSENCDKAENYIQNINQDATSENAKSEYQNSIELIAKYQRELSEIYIWMDKLDAEICKIAINSKCIGSRGLELNDRFRP